MVREVYIYVLVRIDGRHMYCKSASLNMSPILVLINAFLNVVGIICHNGVVHLPGYHI